MFPNSLSTSTVRKTKNVANNLPNNPLLKITLLNLEHHLTLIGSKINLFLSLNLNMIIPTKGTLSLMKSWPILGQPIMNQNLNKKKQTLTFQLS